MNYADADPTGVSLRFDRSALLQLGQELAVPYANAQPFPHAVLDGLFPDEVLDAVLAEFPTPDEMEHRFDGPYELKSASSAWAAMGPTTRSVLAELNFGPFVEFLEVLTGITALVPDPFLVGGGQHQISAGGRLGIHADFNFHQGLRLDRRLNILLYLNRDWSDDWCGHLELWDATTNTCVQRIRPQFNRCVVFSVTDVALHGHPDPLECPPSRTRKSLALYYYTNGRPEAEWSPDHTTLFHSRPGSADPSRLRLLASDLVPPILSRGAKNAKNRLRARQGRTSPRADP